MNKEETTILNVQGLGNVRVARIGDTLMVSLNDVLEGIGKKTPAKVEAIRAPSLLRTKFKDGRTTTHMVDIAAAITVVASSRGIAPERTLIAVTGLLELYAKNTHDGEITQPLDIPNLAVPSRGDRKIGVTVPEVLRKMGWHRAVHAGSAAMFVSENYQGLRDRTERGVVFMDEAQVTRLLRGHVERHVKGQM